MSDFITNAELRIEAERLCDENERLKAENAELREERDEFKALFELKETQFNNVLSSVEMIKAENDKLCDLCKRFAEYVSHDRCEGCVCKSRCDDGEIEECWQRTEIREAAGKLGIEVQP